MRCKLSCPAAAPQEGRSFQSPHALSFFLSLCTQKWYNSFYDPSLELYRIRFLGIREFGYLEILTLAGPTFWVFCLTKTGKRPGFSGSRFLILRIRYSSIRHSHFPGKPGQNVNKGGRKEGREGRESDANAALSVWNVVDGLGGSIRKSKIKRGGE